MLRRPRGATTSSAASRSSSRSRSARPALRRPRGRHHGSGPPCRRPVRWSRWRRRRRPPRRCDRRAAAAAGPSRSAPRQAGDLADGDLLGGGVLLRAGTRAPRDTGSSTTRAPSSLTAPMASSGRCGTPTLRTTRRPAGRPGPRPPVPRRRRRRGAGPGRRVVEGHATAGAHPAAARPRPGRRRPPRPACSASTPRHGRPPPPPRQGLWSPPPHPAHLAVVPGGASPNLPVLRGGRRQTCRFCTAQPGQPGSSARGQELTPPLARQTGRNRSGVPVQWWYRRRPGHHRRASGRNGPRTARLTRTGRVGPSQPGPERSGAAASRGDGGRQARWYRGAPGPIRVTSSSCTRRPRRTARSTSTETTR